MKASRSSANVRGRSPQLRVEPAAHFHLDLLPPAWAFHAPVDEMPALSPLLASAPSPEQDLAHAARLLAIPTSQLLAMNDPLHEVAGLWFGDVDVASLLASAPLHEHERAQAARLGVSSMDDAPHLLHMDPLQAAAFFEWGDGAL